MRLALLLFNFLFVLSYDQLFFSSLYGKTHIVSEEFYPILNIPMVFRVCMCVCIVRFSSIFLRQLCKFELSISIIINSKSSFVMSFLYVLYVAQLQREFFGDARFQNCIKLTTACFQSIYERKMLMPKCPCPFIARNVDATFFFEHFKSSASSTT